MAGTVSRLYGDFRGVDLRGEECSLQRSPDSLNMWRDYRESNCIRTRPSHAHVYTIAHAQINSISFYKDKMMIHQGGSVSVLDGDKNPVRLGGATNQISQAFVYNDIWYVKAAGMYMQYDGEEYKGVEAYIPTTSIGSEPDGSGRKTHQDVNMLTPKRINTFVADGVSKEFHLDSAVAYGMAVTITANGERVSNYSTNYADGIVTLGTAPEEPLTEGQDNVVIEFQSANDQSWKILKCSLTQVFDNRVFFSGNPDYPNMIWHSAVDDPTYVSDLDYYQDGRDEAAIRALVAGNDALWVFREPSDENTTVFYHRPALDENYGKIYPAVHSSIATGCVGKAINFNDDIVFFSERGMEGVSGDIATEQVLGHRSSLVDRKLISEPGYKDMVLAEWEGYLLVFIGNKVYLADSRGKFANGDHYEYEWFYWELPAELSVTSATVHDGVLYFGYKPTAGALHGIFKLTAQDVVDSYWTTPKDKFKNPNRLKTTNKRGCVVEATGDVAVYAKTEDTDYEQIADEKGVTDYFVPRIKQKKFKDIQLKFQSDTRFSLETVTLECFIGGYIKR